MPFLQFTFDELPMVIDRGFEAGLVAGSAEIRYHRDGEWSIRGISLTGHRLKTGWNRPSMDEVARGVSMWDRREVSLDVGDPLYSLIYHRLENEWRATVQEAVNARIVEDRHGDPDAAYDRRRDDAMEAL